MPYIVTTKQHPRATTRPTEATIRSRRAVATLEEAREYAKDECIASEGASIAAASEADGIEYDRWDHRYAPFEAQCETIPESGGTIGPLPDGTVIEVARVSWEYVQAGEHMVEGTAAEIIDAFNAQQVHA